MIRPTSGNPTPPEGFAEYLALLSQNSSLLSTLQSSSTVSTPLPPTPTQGRSFSRPGRGTGGALVEKQKALKDVKSPATKRKSLVDPHAEVQVLPAPEVTEDLNTRQPKRPKFNKVC